MTEERRKYPREFVQIFVGVRVRNSELEDVEVNGVTVNISRGGMLALLDNSVPISMESDCEVRFKEPGGGVKPEIKSGVVVRSEPRGPDREVAIDFQTPLDTLTTGNL